ncbi:DUF4861 domain-containing protein [Bacteroidia bacterium]|nr:DUF4861 domain-containing protein [Bacteroidia bacterium]
MRRAAMYIMLTLWTVAAFGAGRSERVEVRIKNPIDIGRNSESVRVEWDVVARRTGAAPADVVVTDARGRQIPSQVLYEGKTEPQALLFQADVASRGTARYYVARGVRDDYPVRAGGRYVPERLDDYAWENNLIAFRLYGPALRDPVAPGIDVWVKSTDKMVIDKWYAKPGGLYHINDGEGMDCFKVGSTLGCGASAPVVDGHLALYGNYATWQTLDNGPLRTTVRLTYGPSVAGQTQVALEKVISLDANTRFNRMIDRYTGSFTSMNIAAGLVLHGDAETVTDNSPHPSYACVVEQASDSKDPVRDGKIYMAVVMPASTDCRRVDDHLALVAGVAPGRELHYLMGAGWSQGGITDTAMWGALTRQEMMKMRSPLKVTVK